ncbi:hypothetical protein GCM10010531_27800 [Blastococcus jejuensis]|uniref:Uncharacterized protein n=1 Tax=Blastococcus jejuensis TaxID=351224 RepID=A0ABP6P9W3_9ACTN
MNPILAHKTLNDILRTADRLGATTPKAITEEHRRLATAADRSRVMYRDLRDDLTTVVVEAFADGRDPSTDPAVQQAVTRQALIHVQHGVAQAIAGRTAELLTEHGPAILAGFRKPFDQAAATITAAVQRVGNVSIDDMHAVLARGGDAAKAWAEAREANEIIAGIQQTWKLLSTATSRLHVDRRYWLLTIAEVPAETFVDEDLAHVNVKAWDAARRGFTLSLATPETLRQRIKAVQAETQRRQSEYDGAFAKAARQRYGTGAVA